MRTTATVLSALVLMVSSLQTRGEVLGHISDETEPNNSVPDSSQNNDRQIIYRVICTPGGEVLPDCERPFNDNETLEEPSPKPKGESKLNAFSDDELIQTPKATTASKKSSKKAQKSKKSSSKKKSKKKAAAKKTAPNKK